jgi:hypothetical protein
MPALKKSKQSVPKHGVLAEIDKIKAVNAAAELPANQPGHDAIGSQIRSHGAARRCPALVGERGSTRVQTGG